PLPSALLPPGVTPALASGLSVCLLSLFPDASVIVARQLLRGLAILQRQLHHAALAQLSGGLAVDLLPRRLRFRHLRRAFGLAAGDRRLVDQRVASAVVEVDADHVAGAQPRQTAPGGAFGTGIEDRGAVRRARLPPVAERREP